MEVYEARMAKARELDSTDSKDLTKALVSQVEDEIKAINDDAEGTYDELVEALARDRENTNEDAEIALADLKDFLIKNDAILEEGVTYDQIIDEKCRPLVLKRRSEADQLIGNSVKYLEETDEAISEALKNFVGFMRDLATKFDQNKELLKTTEMNFQIKLAQCGDSNDDHVSQLESDLEKKVKEMKHAIHHVELNQKLSDCFELLD